MSCAADLPLTIVKGIPLSESFRWMQPVRAYKPIAAATLAAPCVIQVPGHGVPPGWPMAITGAKGLTQINRGNLNEGTGLISAVVVDADHLQLNEVNALALNAYTGGGIVEYFLPVDLSAFTEAEAQIRATLESDAALDTLTKTGGEIVLDNTAKLITLQLTAARTAAVGLPIGAAVYNLVLTDSGNVDRVLIPNSPVSIELSATR